MEDSIKLEESEGSEELGESWKGGFEGVERVEGVGKVGGVKEVEESKTLEDSKGSEKLLGW